MLFEIIDKQQQCKSVFSPTTPLKIIKDPSLKEHDDLKTWDFHPSLQGLDVDYGYLFSRGMSLNNVCPDDLKPEWRRVNNRYKAFLRSFKEGQVTTRGNCFFDMVPETFMKELFDVKCKITDHVLNTHERPWDYNHLVDLSELVYQISKQQLNINPKALYPYIHTPRGKNLYKKLKTIKPYIDYNIFGTVTGRMTTTKRSFPILGLDKKFRGVLEPTNDVFIELDYNAADLRAILGLNKQSQPQEDMHEWHRKTIGNESLTRDEAKVKTLSWFYGPDGAPAPSPQILQAYDKKSLLRQYWDGYQVTNSHGRIISADKFHAPSLLGQSELSDVFLRQVIKVFKLLKERKSRIAWTIHDSLVLDFDLEDKDLFTSLVSVFAKTKHGLWKTNLTIGKNFAEMRNFNHAAVNN